MTDLILAHCGASDAEHLTAALVAVVATLVVVAVAYGPRVVAAVRRRRG